MTEETADNIVEEQIETEDPQTETSDAPVAPDEQPADELPADEDIPAEQDQTDDLPEEPQDSPETEDFDDSDEPDDPEQSDAPTELDDEIETDLTTVVEAILFASDEPLPAQRLIKIIEAGSVKQVRRAVKDLNKKYKQTNTAFRIEQIAGGYQMMTLTVFNQWIKKLLRVRTDNKLTPAALEALAIVAYKQPIIRPDIEAIRGVASGEVLRNLMYKGLVKMVGRAEVIGRPMLYGTTKKFLDTFGLNTLKDLPKIEELKKPEP